MMIAGSGTKAPRHMANWLSEADSFLAHKVPSLSLISQESCNHQTLKVNYETTVPLHFKAQQIIVK